MPPGVGLWVFSHGDRMQMFVESTSSRLRVCTLLGLSPSWTVRANNLNEFYEGFTGLEDLFPQKASE